MKGAGQNDIFCDSIAVEMSRYFTFDFPQAWVGVNENLEGCLGILSRDFTEMCVPAVQSCKS